MRHIDITLGDITLYKGDAIVNAANLTLMGGGGVDGAIHQAAGAELRNECLTLGGCDTGMSKMTNAYNLPCDKVIHTVGPIWHGGNDNEDAQLASCYRSALTLAMAHDLYKIAFPCISTGAYRFPKDRAARIAMETIQRFLSDHSELPFEVTIVCFSEEDKRYYDALTKA